MLTADLACTGTAVHIHHDNVHFNLGGFTISGDGTTGTGIHVNGVVCPARSAVHINGGTVTGFDVGIDFCKVTKSHINGVTVTSNKSVGILLQEGSDNNRINGSTVSFNGTGAQLTGGVILNNSNRNAIHTMDINNNRSPGVFFRFANFNRITSSEIIDNVVTGISPKGSDGITIQSNNISGSNQGISIATGEGVTIRGNTSSDNSVVGIKIFGVKDSVVRGNIAKINTRFGIEVAGNSFDNLLQSNTALGNGTDMKDPNAAAGGTSPCDNTWKSNTFVTKTDPAGWIQ